MPRTLLALLLCAIATATTTTARAEGWSAGSQASGEDTYVGVVDEPSPGASLPPNAQVVVRGWVVDQTAEGWSGIDQVQVFAGTMDGGGRLLANASVAQDRQDVAQTMGNPFWAASGWSAVVPAGALTGGSNALNVYIHAPDKGWWSRPLPVQVQAAPVPVPVAASRQFSDDPLVVVQAPLPDTAVEPSVQTLTVRGIALDRNAAANTGVGGSGVSHVIAYLDGDKRQGTFLGEATLGKTSRDATGWGERFGTAGWEMQIHPTEIAEDPHALFIYARSAVSDNETLVIVPFRIISH
jgi:hypothetical protein